MKKIVTSVFILCVLLLDPQEMIAQSTAPADSNISNTDNNPSRQEIASETFSILHESSKLLHEKTFWKIDMDSLQQVISMVTKGQGLITGLLEDLNSGSIAPSGNEITLKSIADWQKIFFQELLNVRKLEEGKNGSQGVVNSKASFITKYPKIFGMNELVTQ
jgi:hypothetical protein